MITGMFDGWEWLTRHRGGEVLSYVDSETTTPIPAPLRTTAFEQDARERPDDAALDLHHRDFRYAEQDRSTVVHSSWPPSPTVL